MSCQIPIPGSLLFLNLQIAIIADFILIFRNSIYNKKSRLPCWLGIEICASMAKKAQQLGWAADIRQAELQGARSPIF
jgi:hypothetical protein